MNARLHLPRGGAPHPQEAMIKKHHAARMRTKNPFAYLSGSIAASHKRKRAKAP